MPVAVSQVPRTMGSVIASRQKAPECGPGHLLVDGCDESVVRKATFGFNPCRRREQLLLALLAVCCEVYNVMGASWRRSRVDARLRDGCDGRTVGTGGCRRAPGDPCP